MFGRRLRVEKVGKLNVMLVMGPLAGFLLLSNSGSTPHTSYTSYTPHRPPTPHSHLVSLLLLYLQSSPFQNLGKVLQTFEWLRSLTFHVGCLSKTSELLSSL